MKIVIFGASGKVGKLLTNSCLEAGHQVIAYVRNLNSIEQKHENLKVIEGQLNEAEKIREAVSGADACISTLGGNSLTKSSVEFTQGIENIVKTMEQEKVTRLVYLSSIGAGESKNLMSPVTRFLIAGAMLRVPLADHTRNERNISASTLNWTIVRPGGLRDEPAHGNFRQGVEIKTIQGNLYIPRADVANFMMGQVNDNKYLKKSVWLCV